jgi:predicted nucleic-acid-binding protein
MAAIDTHVLVKFLIQDNELQGHLAKRLIHQFPGFLVLSY